jgi:hypothetical protein
MSDTNGTTAPAWPLRAFAALASRAHLASRLGWLFSGQRQVPEVLGYRPRLEFRDFKARYLRQDIAHRIVRAYPSATWSRPPDLTDRPPWQTPTGAQPTAFEAAWAKLVHRLQVFAQLRQADLLANLGQYSVLLLGLRGQTDLALPARPVRSPDDVLYLTPHSEEWVEVERVEDHPASPTYGQPLLYRVDFRRAGAAKTLVHASRVLHVAEDVLDDPVYGIPRLEPIFDRLDDLLKVVGGSAEMFWRDAKRRIALEVRDDYHLGKEDAAALTAEAEEYQHQLKDFIRVQGVDVKALDGQAVSPREHVDVLIELIAATVAMPIRVLMGTERGDLSSTQDEHAWLQSITVRQQQFAEPFILRALVDRLLELRALPEPQAPYQVLWDNLLSLSEEKQATVAKDIATALASYAPGMASLVVSPQEFRTQYLGLAGAPPAEELPEQEPAAPPVAEPEETS